jgi:DNA modification methylase
MLFDPYCGTGTSLVEANLKGINAIGTDLNPLARLIAKTKTTRIDIQILDLYLKEFNDIAFSLNFGINKPNIILPNFNNIDFWFSKTVQENLAIIKQFIDKITNEEIKNFFYVAFSETVRECSYTKNSEFKLFRMSEKQRQNFKPNVFAIMLNKLSRNKKGLIEFNKAINNKNVKSIVKDFNSVYSIEYIEEKSIDIIVTSPPYGDSRTTVAYGQFSRLANQWLGIEEANKIDNQLMGGKRMKIEKFDIDTIDKIITEIIKLDQKRAEEVFSFYFDYYHSIKNVSKTLKKNSFACYVVGNRKVKGLTLPTDEITKLFFEENGFKHVNTIIRNIPNKRMPRINSPTNKIGKTDNTMNNEYIVIMKKI